MEINDRQGADRQGGAKESEDATSREAPSDLPHDGTGKN